MEDGRVEVHGTITGVMFRGLSLQDLYWYDRSGRRKTRRRIIESGGGKSAFGCKPCGVITIDTTVKGGRARRGKRRVKKQ